MWSHDMKVCFSLFLSFLFLLVASVGRRITITEKICSTLLFCRSNIPHANPTSKWQWHAVVFFTLSLSLYFYQYFCSWNVQYAHTLQTYNNLLNIINVNNQISLYKISIKPMQIQTQIHIHTQKNTLKRNQQKNVCLLSDFGNNTRYKRVINSHDSKTKTFQQIQILTQILHTFFNTVKHATIAFSRKIKIAHILTTNGN